MRELEINLPFEALALLQKPAQGSPSLQNSAPLIQMAPSSVGIVLLFLVLKGTALLFSASQDALEVMLVID